MLHGSTDEHEAAPNLLAGLEELKQEIDEFGSGGNQMTITLERSAGDPLVVVKALGLGAFMNVIELFQGLGLTDRLEGQESDERGVDAAFA